MLQTKQEIIPLRYKVIDVPTALFLFCALGSLYWFLFIPPFLPVDGNGVGDTFIYLAPGQRMYQGDMIYRDVFEFVTPGTALVNFFMFKLFGLRLWIPDLLAVLSGSALAWLGVVISRKLMRPGVALLPSAIFLVSARTPLCDPTHHGYSSLAAIAAIAALMERRTTARIAVAGFLSGISLCFTQTVGLAAIAGFALFLLWESRQKQEKWHGLLKKEIWLAASFLTTFLAVNTYFIWKAGPARFFWCTVVFVLKYYPKQADLNSFNALKTFFPAFVSLRTFLHPFAEWLLLFALIPLTFILFFERYWRESSEKPLEYWERPMMVAMVGFFLFLSSAPAPSTPRMAAISLPGIILLGWWLDSPRKLARVLVVVLTVGTPFEAAHLVARGRPIPVGILATSQGKLAFTDRLRFKELTWIQQHTQPLDYFYAPADRSLYFYLNLRNPTPQSIILNSGYTTSQQVEEALRGLELHQVHYILWSSGDLDLLPAWEGPSEDHLGPLRDYIHNNYKLVEEFPNDFEIWEKQT